MLLQAVMTKEVQGEETRQYLRYLMVLLTSYLPRSLLGTYLQVPKGSSVASRHCLRHVRGG